MEPVEAVSEPLPPSPPPKTEDKIIHPPITLFTPVDKRRVSTELLDPFFNQEFVRPDHRGTLKDFLRKSISPLYANLQTILIHGSSVQAILKGASAEDIDLTLPLNDHDSFDEVVNSLQHLSCKNPTIIANPHSRWALIQVVDNEQKRLDIKVIATHPQPFSCIYDEPGIEIDKYLYHEKGEGSLVSHHFSLDSWEQAIANKLFQPFEGDPSEWIDVYSETLSPQEMIEAQPKTLKEKLNTFLSRTTLGLFRYGVLFATRGLRPAVPGLKAGFLAKWTEECGHKDHIVLLSKAIARSINNHMAGDVPKIQSFLLFLAGAYHSFGREDLREAAIRTIFYHWPEKNNLFGQKLGEAERHFSPEHLVSLIHLQALLIDQGSFKNPLFTLQKLGHNCGEGYYMLQWEKGGAIPISVDQTLLHLTYRFFFLRSFNLPAASSVESAFHFDPLSPLEGINRLYATSSTDQKKGHFELLTQLQSFYRQLKLCHQPISFAQWQEISGLKTFASPYDKAQALNRLLYRLEIEQPFLEFQQIISLLLVGREEESKTLVRAQKDQFTTDHAWTFNTPTKLFKGLLILNQLAPNNSHDYLLLLTTFSRSLSHCLNQSEIDALASVLQAELLANFPGNYSPSGQLIPYDSSAPFEYKRQIALFRWFRALATSNRLELIALAEASLSHPLLVDGELRVEAQRTLFSAYQARSQTAKGLSCWLEYNRQSKCSPIENLHLLNRAIPHYGNDELNILGESLKERDGEEPALSGESIESFAKFVLRLAEIDSPSLSTFLDFFLRAASNRKASPDTANACIKLYASLSETPERYDYLEKVAKLIGDDPSLQSINSDLKKRLHAKWFQEIVLDDACPDTAPYQSVYPHPSGDRFALLRHLLTEEKLSVEQKSQMIQWLEKGEEKEKRELFKAFGSELCANAPSTYKLLALKYHFFDLIPAQSMDLGEWNTLTQQLIASPLHQTEENIRWVRCHLLERLPQASTAACNDFEKFLANLDALSASAPISSEEAALIPAMPIEGTMGSQMLNRINKIHLSLMRWKHIIPADWIHTLIQQKAWYLLDDWIDKLNVHDHQELLSRIVSEVHTVSLNDFLSNNSTSQTRALDLLKRLHMHEGTRALLEGLSHEYLLVLALSMQGGTHQTIKRACQVLQEIPCEAARALTQFNNAILAAVNQKNSKGTGTACRELFNHVVHSAPALVLTPHLKEIVETLQGSKSTDNVKLIDKLSRCAEIAEEKSKKRFIDWVITVKRQGYSIPASTHQTLLQLFINYIPQSEAFAQDILPDIYKTLRDQVIRFLKDDKGRVTQIFLSRIEKDLRDPEEVLPLAAIVFENFDKEVNLFSEAAGALIQKLPKSDTAPMLKRLVDSFNPNNPVHQKNLLNLLSICSKLKSQIDREVLVRIILLSQPLSEAHLSLIKELQLTDDECLTILKSDCPWDPSCHFTLYIYMFSRLEEAETLKSLLNSRYSDEMAATYRETFQKEAFKYFWKAPPDKRALAEKRFPFLKTSLNSLLELNNPSFLREELCRLPKTVENFAAAQTVFADSEEHTTETRFILADFLTSDTESATWELLYRSRSSFDQNKTWSKKYAHLIGERACGQLFHSPCVQAVKLIEPKTAIELILKGITGELTPQQVLNIRAYLVDKTKPLAEPKERADLYLKLLSHLIREEIDLYNTLIDDLMQLNIGSLTKFKSILDPICKARPEVANRITEEHYRSGLISSSSFNRFMQNRNDTPSPGLAWDLFCDPNLRTAEAEANLKILINHKNHEPGVLLQLLSEMNAPSRLNLQRVALLKKHRAFTQLFPQTLQLTRSLDPLMPVLMDPNYLEGESAALFEFFDADTLLLFSQLLKQSPMRTRPSCTWEESYVKALKALPQNEYTLALIDRFPICLVNRDYLEEMLQLAKSPELGEKLRASTCVKIIRLIQEDYNYTDLIPKLLSLDLNDKENVQEAWQGLIVHYMITYAPDALANFQQMLVQYRDQVRTIPLPFQAFLSYVNLQAISPDALSDVYEREFKPLCLALQGEPIFWQIAIVQLVKRLLYGNVSPKKVKAFILSHHECKPILQKAFLTLIHNARDKTNTYTDFYDDEAFIIRNLDILVPLNPTEDDEFQEGVRILMQHQSATPSCWMPFIATYSTLETAGFWKCPPIGSITKFLALSQKLNLIYLTSFEPDLFAKLFTICKTLFRWDETVTQSKIIELQNAIKKPSLIQSQTLFRIISESHSIHFTVLVLALEACHRVIMHREQCDEILHLLELLQHGSELTENIKQLIDQTIDEILPSINKDPHLLNALSILLVKCQKRETPQRFSDCFMQKLIHLLIERKPFIVNSLDPDEKLAFLLRTFSLLQPLYFRGQTKGRDECRIFFELARDISNLKNWALADEKDLVNLKFLYLCLFSPKANFNTQEEEEWVNNRLIELFHFLFSSQNPFSKNQFKFLNMLLKEAEKRIPPLNFSQRSSLLSCRASQLLQMNSELPGELLKEFADWINEAESLMNEKDFENSDLKEELANLLPAIFEILFTYPELGPAGSNFLAFARRKLFSGECGHLFTAWMNYLSTLAENPDQKELINFLKNPLSKEFYEYDPAQFNKEIDLLLYQWEHQLGKKSVEAFCEQLPKVIAFSTLPPDYAIPLQARPNLSSVEKVRPYIDRLIPYSRSHAIACATLLKDKARSGSTVEEAVSRCEELVNGLENPLPLKSALLEGLMSNPDPTHYRQFHLRYLEELNNRLKEPAPLNKEDARHHVETLFMGILRNQINTPFSVEEIRSHLRLLQLCNQRGIFTTLFNTDSNRLNHSNTFQFFCNEISEEGMEAECALSMEFELLLESLKQLNFNDLLKILKFLNAHPDNLVLSRSPFVELFWAHERMRIKDDPHSSEILGQLIQLILNYCVLEDAELLVVLFEALELYLNTEKEEQVKGNFSESINLAIQVYTNHFQSRHTVGKAIMSAIGSVLKCNNLKLQPDRYCKLYQVLYANRHAIIDLIPAETKSSSHYHLLALGATLLQFPGLFESKISLFNCLYQQLKEGLAQRKFLNDELERAYLHYFVEVIFTIAPPKNRSKRPAQISECMEFVLDQVIAYEKRTGIPIMSDPIEFITSNTKQKLLNKKQAEAFKEKFSYRT